MINSDQKNPMGTGESIKELLNSVAVIVGAKADRFRSKLRLVETNPPFETITRPGEQIAIILSETKKLVDRVCHQRVPPDAFDATVMYKQSKNWEYLVTYQTNKGKSSDPNLLLRVNSTAKKTYETGQEQFFASKNEAVRQNCYHRSERDNTVGGDGSIYSKLLKVETPQGTNEFIVTFVTYGFSVCDYRDTESSAAWCLLFREFTRRIEVELILLSIREFRKRINQQRLEKEEKK